MNDKEKMYYWKSLEERNKDAAALETKQDEFSEILPLGDLADAATTTVTRRDFLKLMGFSLAAVSAACSRMPVKKAVPYLTKPEEIVPGKSYWYASTCAGCSAGCGTLVKTRDGRPIKMEGNPESPMSQGGLCAGGQAFILGLYDSGRLHGPILGSVPADWGQVDSKIAAEIVKVRQSGKKVRFLSSTMLSPTSKNLIGEFLGTFSDAKHVVYDAISQSSLTRVHEKSLGLRALPHFCFDKAEVIVSLDADFLGTWISPVEFARHYAKRRNPGSEGGMSHHIQFESRMSLSGANADVRVPIKASELRAVALYLLKNLSGDSVVVPSIRDEVLPILKETVQKLRGKNGRSLVISGSNDFRLQSIVARINSVLENYGTTLDTAAPSFQKQGSDSEMQDLIGEMERGEVGLLFIHEANPIYDWADSGAFKKALGKVGFSVSFARYDDETASLCSAILPDHHALESWDDAEPILELRHLRQPVIRPIYDTRQMQDGLLRWLDRTETYLDHLKASWRRGAFLAQTSFFDFESFWNHCVHDGVFSFPTTSLEIAPAFVADAVSSADKLDAPAVSQGYELTVYPSVALGDGAQAGNPWLQELPDPISKVSWDNYASLAPSLATEMGLNQNDVILIKHGGQELKLPVFIQPGQVAGTLAVALGYGRTKAGKAGNGVGQNVYPFTSWNSSDRHYALTGVMLEKTTETYELAASQTHHSLEGRDIVRETTLKDWQDKGEKHHAVMLWDSQETKGPNWGMAVDLNACIGCAGCVVSCQAENNVPVVGRDEVRNRREMHWIRIDRYYQGSEENPATVFQPMMCQHCANAPCESVCPVLATVHSSDGLNQQVYNRCVGTRYCANNCPYKVRRFNWFDYAGNNRFDYNMNDDVGRLALNPDIVVRSRGVMEKCSLCVQRIQEGKLTAKLEGRELREGDIRTACQQSCPSDAIVFGDLNDPKSRISKLLKKEGRDYQVLSELNVKPNVNYLAKIRNR